jgi:protein tyrosine/serine phosphatase
MRAQGLSRARAAVYVVMLLAIPGAAQPQAVRPSIDNFGTVNENYYRGAQPEGRAYTELAAFGVKTVIDLQEDGVASEPTQVERAGMKYVRIPMSTRRAPTAAQMAQFLELVNDPANQPVYVHCAGGRHRTGVMTAAFRMSVDGWTSDRAFKEMKSYKFGADFLHPEFKRYVYAYRPEPGAAKAADVVAETEPAAATPAEAVAGTN